MSNSTSSTLLIILLIITFPLWIGIAGGLIGLVLGLAGAIIGIIAAVFGVIGSILSGIFGAIFGVFDWGYADVDFFDFSIRKFIGALLLIAVIAMIVQSKKTKRA